MSLLPHWIHIFQKPAEGTTFIKRYQAVNYEHKINIMGWFDTAACELGVTQAEAEVIFENYVGNRVAIYVDNPAEPIWEGYIATISYTAGGLAFRRSMDNMANRVYTNHERNVAGTKLTIVGATASTAASQSIYGVKEIAVKGRLRTNTNVTTNMDLMRDRMVAEIAFPQTSVTIKGQGNAFIKLEMRGFFDTLSWERVQDDRVNEEAPVGAIEVRYLPNMLNGTTFFDNTDFTELDTPGVTVRTTQSTKTGETGRDYLENIAEFGDGVDLWMIGITPTLSSGLRRLYYRATNKVVEYTARTDDGLRIRNQFGGLLRPWTITPDKIIRINDILVGWNAIGDDPRETYMKGINYKQNANAVTWIGEDDVTMEGVMTTFSKQKQFQQVFGQKPNITFD